MSGQIQVRSSWQVSNGNLIYQSQPTTFTITQLLALGPTPGVLAATQAGVQVPLTPIVTPGLCLLANIGTTYYFQWGPYLPVQKYFVPVGVVYPGQIWGICLDPYFGQAEGTDPGTDPHETGIQLWIKGVGGTAQAVVSCFSV
jgi:hypothetical protein